MIINLKVYGRENKNGEGKKEVFKVFTEFNALKTHISGFQLNQILGSKLI